MAQRLVDLFNLGDRVDIYLERAGQGDWTPGQVVAHDFPGVWVQTDGAGRWFVTNHRRIRPQRQQPGSQER